MAAGLPKEIHMKKLIAASMAAAALAAFSAVSIASASHTVSVDGTATVSPNGRQAHVTGKVECDPSDRRVTVIVTVFDSTSETTASGKSGVACGDGTVPWDVTVRAKGSGLLFEPGADTQVFVAVNGHDSLFEGFSPLILEAAP
jgi:hypothetical protein